jgi:hypothetical protein
MNRHAQAWEPRVVGGFDRLAFRQALRASGLLASLTRSELAVLWFAFDYAGTDGQVDLPRDYLAEQAGMTRKAARSACESLEAKGVLERVKSRSSRVARYALVEPAADPGVSDAVGSVSAGGLRIAQGGSTVTPRGGSGVPPEQASGGSGLPAEGVVGYPQRQEERYCMQQGRAQKLHREVSERDGRGAGLFDSGGFDAAAAAILCSAGLSKSVARGLAVRYRVTRLEARNVRANMRAARRAVGVSNPAGWVRAAVQRGEVMIEQRVQAALDARRVKLRRRRQAAERSVEASRASRAASEAAARRGAAERRLRAMGAAEREALREAVLAGVDESGGQGGLTFKPSEVLIEGWMVDELMKRESEVCDGQG